MLTGAGPARDAPLLVYASIRSTDPSEGGNPDRVANLFLVRTDGSGLRRLTRTAAWDDQPAWAPNRRRIAFSRGEPLCHGGSCEPGPIQAGIWVIGAGGRGQRRLTDPGEDIVDASPSWSPDSGSIAFVRALQTDLSPDEDGIYVMAADGKGLRRVAAKRARSVDWSPDGKTLAYVVVRLGLIDVDTRRARPLAVSKLPGELADVAWSPNGRRLALAGAGGVYVVPARGGTARRVVRARGVESVAWSPDGKLLAFSARPGTRAAARTDLFVVGVDGGGLGRVTGNPGADLAPDWRP